MEIVIDKKQIQLGMNPSTASGRLVKDILYRFIVDTGNNNCYKCGMMMCRDTFSIEHKTPWLDSDDPLGLYFDLENISFSHGVCNTKAGRKPSKYATEKDRKAAKSLNTQNWKVRNNITRTPQQRNEEYKRRKARQENIMLM